MLSMVQLKQLYSRLPCCMSGASSQSGCTCSGRLAAGVPSSLLYAKAPIRSNLKVLQNLTSSLCCVSVSPAGRQRVMAQSTISSFASET